MTRSDVLDAARQAVTADRNRQHGEPEDNFKLIADLWSAFTGQYLTAHDVAVMMVLFKAARAKTSPEPVGDNYVDMAGYAACAAEVKR